MATLSIMTVNGQSAEIIPEALLALKGGLRGQALAKDEDGYDTARSIWNGMVDRSPGLIVRCHGAADVMHAVAEYSISYRTPVRGTGEIGVHFWVETLGETSAVYRFRILSADGQTVHAEGRRVNVKLDPHTLRPAPWSDDARTHAATLLAA